MIIADVQAINKRVRKCLISVISSVLVFVFFKKVLEVVCYYHTSK